MMQQLSKRASAGYLVTGPDRCGRIRFSAEAGAENRMDMKA
jgi:hypothetical protein